MSLPRRLCIVVGVLVGAFVYLGNAIPQIKTEAVEVVTVKGATPETLVAAGKKIFESDRAQCLTCHTLGEDPKARCPNMEEAGANAHQRRPGVSAADYFVESTYNPNAFTVEGYPTNQMQPVNKAPIALTHDEIFTVIAYLNSLGGVTDAAFLGRVRAAQVPWRKGLLKPDETVARADRLPVLPGDAARGKATFEKQICLQCHRVGASGKDICPDLTAIGASQSGDYILESIVDPSAVIVRGYQRVIVLWEDEDEMPIRGVPIEWIPSKERPLKLRLLVDEEGERHERVVDLADATYVGDTKVGVEEDDEFEVVVGEYVKGDEKTGVTLKVLDKGRWVERTIAADVIDHMNTPVSPMPGNFAELMTAREIYDIVAYLMAQKGKK